MKTFIKATIAAVALEVMLLFGAWVTFGELLSGGSGGLLSIVAFVTWWFHMIGYFVADKYAQSNGSFWLIMFLVGSLQSFVLVWLVIGVHRWKHAS